MKKNIKKKKIIVAYILLILVAVILVLFFVRNGSRNAISGIREPIQEETTGFVNFDLYGYDTTILYKYTYDIEGLVVHTKDYLTLQFGDILSPRDIALAWGNVAKMNKDIDFHWSQMSRFVRWHIDSESDIRRLGGF